MSSSFRRLLAAVLQLSWCVAWTAPALAQEAQQQTMPVAPTPQQANLLDQDPGLADDPSIDAIHLIGCDDQETWCYLEIELPEGLRDVDGGVIRLIMQHELSNFDEMRVVDIGVATEHEDPQYGSGHHQVGRHIWMWISGDWTTSAASLGDNAKENLAGPLGWVWIVDYKWLEGDDLLGGDNIRVYSHPHIKTRMIIYD